jgi:hypothetical protein
MSSELIQTAEIVYQMRHPLHALVCIQTWMCREYKCMSNKMQQKGLVSVH